MKIKVLGCSGGESPKNRPPSFLLDEDIVFDTGSLTNVLDIKDQLKVRYIFITHSHLDHIMGIPFLADGLLFSQKRRGVKIFGIPLVIESLRRNLLDGSIWPDFTIIPGKHQAILSLIELKPGQSKKILPYTITPYEVHHSVPASGYLVEDRRKRRLFYTGDTGPSDSTWKQIGEKQIHCLIIETSFPNRMKEIAIKTGHLTPQLLEKEISKIRHLPERIFVIHPKPVYKEIIWTELQKLKLKHLRLPRDGETIEV
jgi:ribonuclease BN (tRNA processing enzyme)